MILDIAFPVPLHKTFYYKIGPQIDGKLIKPGIRVRTVFGRRIATGIITAVHEDSEVNISGFTKIKEIEEIIDAPTQFGQEIVELSFWISKKWNVPVGIVLFSFFQPVWNAALKDVTPRAISQIHEYDAFFKDGFLKNLSTEQKDVIEKLKSRLGSGSFSVNLLYGPSKTGKSEIYFNLMAEALKNGGQILFLLPDIMLLESFYEEILKRFDSSLVNLWHSKLTAKYRREAWFRIFNGSCRTVLGTRSSVFLPFQKISLIIMDEEEDETYVQEDSEPHFHCRDLIVQRAAFHKACVVLASSCPSLESYTTALSGKWNFLKMTEKVSGAGQYTLSVKKKKKEPGKIISSVLEEKLKNAIENKKQAILIAGRKGYAGAYFCARCGWRQYCPTCKIPMIIDKHETENRFIFLCKQCGIKKEPVEVCPRCFGKMFRHRGIGTQKIEEELKKIFEGIRILRIDSDNLRKTSKQGKKTHEIFLNHKADVLIGTRLISKGYNFSNVSIVGIIDIDFEFSLNDFRAQEKIFQTLVHACGRISNDLHGQFVIQTCYPEHQIFSCLKNLDFELFAAQELEMRKNFFYPPFSGILLCIACSKNEKMANAVLLQVMEKLKTQSKDNGLEKEIEILGPNGYKGKRTKKDFCEYFLLKAPVHSDLSKYVSEIMNVKMPKSVKLKVIPEPYNFR